MKSNLILITTFLFVGLSGCENKQYSDPQEDVDTSLSSGKTHGIDSDPQEDIDTSLSSGNASDIKEDLDNFIKYLSDKDINKLSDTLLTELNDAGNDLDKIKAVGNKERLFFQSWRTDLNLIHMKSAEVYATKEKLITAYDINDKVLSLISTFTMKDMNDLANDNSEKFNEVLKLCQEREVLTNDSLLSIQTLKDNIQQLTQKSQN